MQIDDTVWRALKPHVEEAISLIDAQLLNDTRDEMIVWGDNNSLIFPLSPYKVCEAVEPAMALALLLCGYEVRAHYGGKQ